MYDERIAKLKKQQNQSGQKSGNSGSGGMYDERVASRKAAQMAAASNQKTFGDDLLSFAQYQADRVRKREEERAVFYARHGTNVKHMKYDLEAGQKEIDALEAELSNLRLERNAEKARNIPGNSQ